MPLFLGDQIVAGNANATDTDKKIFLIGATEQTEDSETFSQQQVYAENGILYSKSKEVAIKEDLNSFSTATNLKNGEGLGSLKQGMSTTASGAMSFSIGSSTTASGALSSAEGYITHASGNYSHVEGVGTMALGEGQHVQGIYNVEDSTDTYAHIVGNGEDNENRSNAHTLDWEGNAWFAGNVYVGSTSGVNRDGGSKKLATEGFVQAEVANLVNSAPDKLNTLDELAAALGDDENFATTVTNKITSAQTKADNAYALAEAKQNKITGIAGQFVVIGEDGNITTKTIPNAEEASF